MSEGLRPLTLDEISAFRRREYTLDNCGVFYIRGLVTSCGRDTAEGEALRDKFAAAETEALRAALDKIISIKDDTLGPRDTATSNSHQQSFDRGCRMAFYRCAEIAGAALRDQQKVDPA